MIISNVASSSRRDRVKTSQVENGSREPWVRTRMYGISKDQDYHCYIDIDAYVVAKKKKKGIKYQYTE